MAIDTHTGDFRMLEDATAPLNDGEVLVHGTEPEIERLSRAVKSLNAEEKRRAKRKAQRQARKQNR